MRSGFLVLLLVVACGCRAPCYMPAPEPVFRQQEAVRPLSADAVKSCAAHAAGPALDDAKPMVVSLQEAIHLCIVANLAIQAGQEKVAQAQADFTTAGLVSNPTLLVDSLLNPLGRNFTPARQGGPPQADVAVSFPIDWCLFGKRVAALEAARWGVDVAAADVADLIRLQVTETAIAFYDVLEAKALLEIARQDLADAKKIASITEQLATGGQLAPIEKDRARLVVLDAQRELRRREANVQIAKAKLAPLVGRCAPVADLDVHGDLGIATPASIPELGAAIALAEQQRPDILMLNRQVAMTEAEIVRERKKCYPEVAVQPVFTYQFQEDIGFPDVRTYGVAVTSTLPVTDRNQGNIAKAMSGQRQAIANLHGKIVTMRSEVKQAFQAYTTALEIIQRDDTAMVELAKAVRDKTEVAYGKGQDALLNLLIVQRAYLERVRASVSAKADYWRALQRLNAAVGGLSTANQAPEVLPGPRLGDVAPVP